MLDVAVCGHIELDDPAITLDGIVEACAREAGFAETSVEEFDSPLDLIDAVAHPRSTAEIDFVIIGTGIKGVSTAELVHELRAVGHALFIVLCAESGADPLEILGMHVDCVIKDPISADELRATLARILPEVRALHDDSVVIKFREGIRRIPFPQLIYVETRDRTQAVHLADGTEYLATMTSQAFFDILEDSGRFFKVGSSYIVNLGAVRLVNARQSTVELSDGTTVPVPRRVRKPLEEAILG